MSLKDLSIGKKLGAGFAAVAIVVVSMCSAVFVFLAQDTDASKLNNDSYDMVDRADQVAADHWQEAFAFKSYAASQEIVYLDQFNVAQAELLKDLSAAHGFAGGEAEINQRLDQLKAASDAYEAFASQTMHLLADPATRDQGLAAIRSPEGAAKHKAFDDAQDDLLKYANTWSDKWSDAQKNAVANSRMALMVFGGLALLLAMATGWLLTSAIAKPVSQMTDAMKRLAGGDNTVAVPAVGRKDEVGLMAGAVQTFKEAAIEKIRVEAEVAETRRQAEQERARVAAAEAEAARVQAGVVSALAGGLEKLSDGELTFRIAQPFTAEYEKLRADFNAALEQLQQAMGVISSNAAGMRTGAGEISQAADDLSKRTEQQAATLEETAAALDEITATVKKTADGAVRASTVVGGAKAEAERSGEVVREAVAAMGQIEQSAQKISQIIGVIDEIAFQTNLLALNAGVEAARAGDAGRGFAVVASEVRALAQRSAEAAKEIKTLISASSQQVAQGVTLVGQTGEALTGIVSKVGDITGLVSEITASTQEQASALAQVNTAVNQMDQVTQQNAAMVEQSTAASHSLSQEAEELARLVSRFKTGHEADARGGHAPAPRSGGARPQVAEFRQRYTATAMRPTSQVARAPEPRDESWEEF
ncbi:MAG TPA: methyl-accepting chemotaxis protein [Caulobacteraceae bacterium]|nr:methyl-accepting chemotaxis protein [Caulobacteraceae bacterium]